jgi:hypothetical protein
VEEQEQKRVKGAEAEVEEKQREEEQWRNKVGAGRACRVKDNKKIFA